jgi:hypothetical protein
VVPVVISDVKSGAAGKIQSSWTVVACASCTDNKGKKRKNSISICVVTVQSEYLICTADWTNNTTEGNKTNDRKCFDEEE